MTETKGRLDSEKVAADFFVLESIRWWRKELEHQLCEVSASKDNRVIDILRLQAAFDFAEFFYTLRAQGIESADQLGRLEEAHSRYLESLLKDETKMKRFNLRKTRIEAAMFTGDTRPRLVQDWRERPGAIDQSNLARLLVTQMSTETCRKLVVAGASAGFLVRWKSPYGTMLVASTGVMEDIFGNCLRALRKRIIEGASSP